jgi:hypothetical protein
LLEYGDVGVARLANTIAANGSAPARRALGLEKGNAVTDDIERCELVEEQIVAAHGHTAMDEGLPAPIHNGGCGFWLMRRCSATAALVRSP